MVWHLTARCVLRTHGLQNLEAIDSSCSLDNPEAQASLAAGQISPLPKTSSHYSLPPPWHSQNTNTLTHAFHSWLTHCLALEFMSTPPQETTDRTTSQNFPTTSLGRQLLQTAKTPKLPEHCSRWELLPSKMLATHAHRAELLRCH